MSHPDLTVWFEDIFQRLLAREDFAQHRKDLSGLFEVIATNLFGEFPTYRGCYFDGVTAMTLVLQPSRALEIRGEMWVGRDRNQWTEPFRAKVVDKRSTKQGVWITAWLG